MDNVNGRDHMGDLDINGRKIFQRILKIGSSDVNWTHATHVSGLMPLMSVQ